MSFSRSILCWLLTFSFLQYGAAQQASTNANAKPMIGYSTEASRTEQEWEQKFRNLPVADTIRENMRRLSAFPHNVGSPYDKDNAEWMLSLFKQWGFDAQIETFDVLFPTPKERLVELVGPTHFKAKLQEPTVPGDPTSSQTAMQLPTYNAYSADGDVTGPLVYVNYGMRDDYDELDKLGVSVKGAIVIARYGAGWRGIKPKVAYEHGAKGCIIYSDPADDGYDRGDVFPKGAYRPPEGVQRGSVEDTEYPGDPLTPGVGATKDAKRLPISESKVIEKVPVIPISYADAQPLLAAITGQVAPQKWVGALPITYHIGPGAAQVHLVMKSNWDLKPVYDVIARIQGSTYPDEWVIRGNHHDAWVNGADDPVSGAASVLEEARSLSELVKQGWKPKRTMIYCLWDGEEPGLLGSTEWVETHRAELQQHAVMYVNSDSSSRGYMYASGDHRLERFINDVAKDIQDPEKNISVWQRSRDVRFSRANNAEERTELRTRQDLHIGALGDGSDYTSFLDFAGVAALNIGFGGEGGGGVYHSIYDDFYWYTHFGDTKFVYERALAQLGGTAMMRMADAEMIPLSYGDAADTIAQYVKQIEALLKTEQEKTTETNKQLDEGVFVATSDPEHPTVAPQREQVPPFINFAPLENGSAALKRSSDEFEKALAKAQQQGGTAYANSAVQQLNEKIMQSERGYLDENGLPGRPWFKNQIYAPGAYTGYGVKTIPYVREAIEQKKWTEADEGTQVVGKVLQHEASMIEEAAKKLESMESGK
ncbi:MAG TPA: transferrin receptor-like dimerization domain-containing protein [Terriglobales bacterium]|nr:transferrin receptor-like dimerization domain-containing protein [Terriglobales bacterium]